MCVFIVSFAVALIVSAMCSVAESVLLSLSATQVAQLSNKNKRVGAIWENFKKDVNPPITSILTLNTTAHTVGASFAGASFAKLFGENWVWLFSMIFTFLMLQYTEILPKTLGVRYNMRLASFLARPLYWCTCLCSPFIELIRFLNKPFEPKNNAEEFNAVNEIGVLTSLARSRRLLDYEQEKIILATLKLAKTEVQKVMIPFSETSTLSDDMTPSEALEIARSDSHTRFPVCYGANKNNIVGYVNFKELAVQRLENSEAPIKPEPSDLSSFVREIVRVAPTDNASDVLNVLVKSHDHIALVYDSYKKKNLGILTLEDLVEELVGEIEDEFDRLPETLSESSNGVVRVGGGAHLARVASYVNRLFPEDSETFANEIAPFTVSCRFTDWIESKASGDVSRNQKLDVGNLTFTIRRVRRGKVFDAVIQRSRVDGAGSARKKIG